MSYREVSQGPTHVKNFCRCKCGQPVLANVPYRSEVCLTTGDLIQVCPTDLFQSFRINSSTIADC